MEVVVVAGIMILLAALLQPGLFTAKTAVHRTASLNNVRQIVFAQFLYMDDSDGAIAMNRDCHLVRQGHSGFFAPCFPGRLTRGWIDLVQPYVRGYKVFKSLADPVPAFPLDGATSEREGVGPWEGFVWGPRPAGERLGGEYRSSFARNNNWANNGNYTARQFEAPSPATLVLIYSFAANTGAGASGIQEGVPGSSFTIIRPKGFGPDPGTCRAYDASSTGNSRSSFYSQLPAWAQAAEDRSISSERYNGRALYGFADGHVKALPPERIKGQCSWGDRTLGGVEFGNDGQNPDFRF
jgi:prepilin-type processing-associated H-X9-DG protein